VTVPRPSFAKVAAIFSALAAAYFLSEFFRISHAVIAPDLMRELKISSEGLSVLTSAFFIAFAAVQIPNGVLFDRFGPRRAMPCMILFGAVGAAIFALAPSSSWLSIGRVFLGLGWSIAFMGGLVTLARWVPSEHFAVAVSALITAGALGNIFATAPWAAMVDALGWRISTAIFGGLSLAVAAFVYAVVRDAPPGHPYHARAPETLIESLRGVAAVARFRAWRYLFAMNFVAYAVTITVLGLWAAPYLHDVHGLGPVERGNALLAMTIAIAIGNFAIGPLDRLLDTRKNLVTIGAVATSCVHIVLALTPGLSVFTVTVLFALLGLFGGLIVVNLAHARAILPDQLVGRGLVTMALAAFAGSAFMQMATGVLVGWFPLVEGRVPEIAYRAAFGFIGGTTLLVAIYHRRVSDAKPSADRARER
jgi:MFS family permease